MTWDGGPTVRRLIAEGALPNPTCPVTVTIKTALFRGETRLYRCDREPGHEGQHHGTQKDQSEMFWGGEAARPSGDEALRAARTGRRRITFDNGRYEDYEAVAVWHEPTGEMWDRILILRDDGTLADRIVAALATPSSAPTPGCGNPDCKWVTA